MNLDITPELVKELHEHPSPARDNVAIVLTPAGWEVTALADGRHSNLLAMTAADTDGWVDEDGVFDDDAAEDLASGRVSPGAEPYVIRDEHGEITTPAAEADPYVVTGESRHQWQEPSPRRNWRTAWWFDLAAADLVIDVPARSGAPAEQLYRTESGRWVEHSSGQWHELDQESVAVWAYRSSHVVTGKPQPPVVAAALAARALADALTPPTLPQYVDGSGLRASKPPTEEENAAAADVFLAGRAISELLRAEVLPQVREQRRKAAGICVAWHGSESAAAAALDVSRQTLNQLLNQ